MSFNSDSPVQYVKGVGPRLAQHFAVLGIETIGDLLGYFPFRHEIEQGEVDIADLQPGVTATVRGEVTRVRGRWQSLRVEIYDGTESCTLRWFNQQHVGPGLHQGALVIATGKVQEFNDRMEIIQPRLQIFPPNTILASSHKGSQRVGIYRGNLQIKSNTIRRVVHAVLSHGHLPVEDILPPELCKRHDLPGRAAAIREMHLPTGERQLERARRRLAFEEFFLMELAMALRRYKQVSLQHGRKLHVTPEIDRRIRARFPFTLTSAQDKTVREIVHDLESGRPMTRLLQGDVGSGKTVVALYACLSAIANGRQAAIMAPTEILAQQHFANITKYLDGSRVRHTLLRGKLSKKERAESLAAIEAGEIDLVVGTQALLEKDVAFKDLAMVVVDEQHKFGVLQRANIRTKGPLPHYLVMTATPIPRTLAMTVFGDLDVSIINALPPRRGEIITKVVTRAKWKTVMEYVRGRLEVGEQAYVVCPLIGEEEELRTADCQTRNDERVADEPQYKHGYPKSGVKNPQAEVQKPKSPPQVSAKQAFERLTHGPWRGLEVGLLHGSLKSDEKQATIEAFAAGRLQAVVSTTVVEVGVDVANATIMIVENADRFGLSQLHQLRGRVGRGSKDSLCVLIAHGRGEKAAERLEVMATTTDGFKIAEADLRQRGPGEVLGTRQHGLPELRVGDILNDFGLLEEARRDAFELVASDPGLREPLHARMIPALRKMFGGKLALIDAG